MSSLKYDSAKNTVGTDHYINFSLPYSLKICHNSPQLSKKKNNKTTGEVVGLYSQFKQIFNNIHHSIV